jgi:hypothetical protein
MIQRNPLIKATVTAFLFWYVVLFIPGWFYGAHIFQLPQYLLYAVAIMAAGGLLGFVMVLGLSNLVSRATEQTIVKGGRFRAVQVNLGMMPAMPEAKRASVKLAELEAQPWWNALQTHYPAHAAAAKAVMEVMLTRPDLPASPVPGGHGGRTLIQHSMAVAREIVVQGKTWVYEGQKDRRGKVRVALQGDPHRFGPGDIGLLILTALAHDIGKMTCYEDAGRDSQGRRLVREIQPNHDTAGARLLRTIPEVMALPFADRTALTLAVGYYHHPYALPRGEWITDRMRSLTELLIRADVETGRKEGHTLTHDYSREEVEYDEDATPSQPVEIALDDSEDEESYFSQAAKSGAAAAMVGTTKPSSPPAASTAPSPAQPQRVETEQLPYELDTFLRLIRKDGAINGHNVAKRIAWKVADRVYVMEPVLRRQVAAFGGMAPGAAVDELSENNGNASPYTAKLLEQLHQRGYLVTRYDNQDYAPARAIFVSASPSGSEIPVFILKTEKIPGASSIKDAKPMVIRRPLWGEKRPKGEPQAPAQATLSDAGTSPAAPAPAAGTAWSAMSDADLPLDLGGPVGAPSYESEAQQEIPPKSEPQATTISLSMDDADLPFGLPAGESETNTVAEPPAEPATPAAQMDPDALRDALPLALNQLLESPDWQWSVETLEKDGQTLVVVDVESDAGAAITSVLQRYQEHGVPIDRVRVVTRKATQKPAYVWPKMA